jgi:hypothetical protein
MFQSPPLQCEMTYGRKPFWPRDSSALHYSMISSKLPLHVQHGEEVPLVMFPSPRCNARRDRNEKLFDLMSNVPFLADRFRRNSQSVLRKRRECHLCCFRHHSAMRGEKRSKNCFRLKSKVPFFTRRFRSNSHCLWRMVREFHV